MPSLSCSSHLLYPGPKTEADQGNRQMFSKTGCGGKGKAGVKNLTGTCWRNHAKGRDLTLNGVNPASILQTQEESLDSAGYDPTKIIKFLRAV